MSCVTRRLFMTAVLALLTVAATPAPASALEVRVPRLAVSASRVVAIVELRELLRNQFLQVVQQGRAVFVEIQADLWEDRRVADRLALTTPALTYRIDRAPERGVILMDQYGNRLEHLDVTLPLPVRVDIGPMSALVDDRSYYLHASVTAATVAERDIQQAGTAIFGDRQSTEALAGLGRFVFRTLLRIGQYLDTAAAEGTSERFSGLAIRSAAN